MVRRWYTLTHLDGSVVALARFAQKGGLQGLRAVWPWPSAEAWGIVASFGALEAALQLGLPGAEHRGPVSPKGNVPIYKVTALLFAHRCYCTPSNGAHQRPACIAC